MSDRRSFLKGMSFTMAGLPLGRHLSAFENVDWTNWSEVKNLYALNPQGLINYNTGSAGVLPIMIMDSLKQNLDALASHAAYEIYGQHKENISSAKTRLAQLIGSKAENLSFMRNTTSGINAILYGMDWSADDEIIVSNVAYPLVLNTLKILQSSYGVLVREAKLNLDLDTQADIIRKFSAETSSRSKLMIMTHMTHREGQIMPVKALTELAHSKGILSLVDGAHGIGHFPVNVQDIACDFYATSLHKWLSAPLGTGLLYVSDNMINKLKPPYSFQESQMDKMSKFDMIGTSAFEKLMTLPSVMDFQDKLGFIAKSKRIKSLTTRFRNGLSLNPNARIAGNGIDYGGVTAFNIDGSYMSHLYNYLRDDHGFHLKKVHGYGPLQIRVSLNLHLVESDVDNLVSAIDSFVNK